MISPSIFFEELNKKDIDFFTGVPDSLLKDFCAYVKDNTIAEKNIIAANEGNALAIASGHYLATSKPALVYMQNSGLGNIINPLASLTDESVYSIPALLVIGWRGEPNIKDAPQHTKQGKVTLDLLEIMGIKYYKINKSTTNEEVKLILGKAIEDLKYLNKAVAIVVSKGTFEKYSLKDSSNTTYDLNREQAIEILMNNIEEDYVIVSTTGKTSREVFELRNKYNKGHEKDFLTIGSMGHASSIALGIAKNNNEKNVYVLDGDGAFLMHMGAVSIIGQSNLKNYRHIVINNGAHESVGGQPTVGYDIDICSIAKGCGYDKAYTATTKKELENYIKKINGYMGIVLLEIKTKQGSRENLGRPTMTQVEIKDGFMKNLACR
jgi:phosphonopyruvate decarboxylase